jgi:hypothetical protein
MHFGELIVGESLRIVFETLRPVKRMRSWTSAREIGAAQQVGSWRSNSLLCLEKARSCRGKRQSTERGIRS